MRWWEETELKALQRKWYRLLKKSGFNDIEDPKQSRFVDPQNPLNYYRRFGAEQFSQRAEYYSRASQFLHEYRFKTRTHKQVWHYHTEGEPIRSIAEKLDLVASGSQNSVHRIIKDLQTIMKSWEFEIE